ncbi:hypothetical protein [Pedobacter sp.]|uniref:hypothetical protein n=1 Tax=Pedobacter sp. TaxID=1411316 RepID=UPI00396CED86
MQRKKTYHNEGAKKIGAFLLMLLFLAIPLVQTLHSHHKSNLYNTKISTEKSISNAAEKCLVCDYIAEIKGKQILMAYPPVLDVPTDVCAVLNTFVYTRIYKFTLQNFSNKGPPYLIG